MQRQQGRAPTGFVPFFVLLGNGTCAVAAELEQEKPHFRHALIRSSATAAMSGDALDQLLDSHRWLRRMVYHLARIAHYSCRLRR
ncbi:MAG: hypothetical protein AAF581_23940 [Planctomycetota bacterium]